MMRLFLLTHLWARKYMTNFKTLVKANIQTNCHFYVDAVTTNTIILDPCIRERYSTKPAGCLSNETTDNLPRAEVTRKMHITTNSLFIHCSQNVAAGCCNHVIHLPFIRNCIFTFRKQTRSIHDEVKLLIINTNVLHALSF